MGEYADDAWDPGDPWSWTPREGYPHYRRRLTNQEIFERFSDDFDPELEDDENDTGLTDFRDTYDW